MNNKFSLLNQQLNIGDKVIHIVAGYKGLLAVPCEVINFTNKKVKLKIHITQDTTDSKVVYPKTLIHITDEQFKLFLNTFYIKNYIGTWLND